MYVRKFEADTLNEALQNIKKELGPDAIILKTVTNKGIKGTFKKKKIEITAAISEKNYTKKIKVDHVLSDDQKDTLYNTSSSYISNMIDDYSTNDTKNYEKSTTNIYSNGYINTTDNTHKISHTEIDNRASGANTTRGSDLDSFLSMDETYDQNAIVSDEPRPIKEENNRVKGNISDSISDELLNEYSKKVSSLEKKLHELSTTVGNLNKLEPKGIIQLTTTLKGMGIDNFYIQKLLRKISYDLPPSELEKSETVFEYALQEMLGEVYVSPALFSSEEGEDGSLTFLMSSNSCGQTSMALKLSALRPDSLIIEFDQKKLGIKKTFAEEIFNIERIKVENISELVSECRKGLDKKRSIFIDYKCNTKEDETKQIVEGLQRSFKNVEVLLSLSAIHSEIYNKNMINTYGKLADGLLIGYLDQCLSFGSIFNLFGGEFKRPCKFYGTGPVIPDDIEAATAERILAGIFHL
jgi:flagellar biosynthesis GTPase FlhF